MNVTVASHAGFCFGVRRATEAVENAIKQGGGEIVTLGRLIHNDGYCASLAARGVREISTGELPAVLDRVRTGVSVTVVIRAHGESADVVRTLEECAAEYPNLTVLNCTCPFVEKVRKIAFENSGEGKRFYLLGAPEHPEVKGILSCADGGTVFETAEQLSAILEKERAEACEKVTETEEITVSVASQTTQKLSEWKKSLEILKKAYTNAKIYDTICIVTEERQKEAAELAGASDVMLIIGSRASSNTAKLYAVCRERCPRSHLIESAADLAGIDFTGCQTVSITAGASTPFSVIQEVKQTMSEKNFAELLEESMKTLNTGD